MRALTKAETRRTWRVILGIASEGLKMAGEKEKTMEYKAVINGKTITARTFSQLKRKASIEANKNNRIFDEFYLLRAPGLTPLLFIRHNKKAPNNTITRGTWA